jgi:hypothetical protein
MPVHDTGQFGALFFHLGIEGRDVRSGDDMEVSSAGFLMG